MTPWASAAFSRGFEEANSRNALLSADAASRDEDFWYYIQQSFSSSPNVINRL